MSRKAIACLLILLPASIGSTRGDSQIIERVEVGFAGAYKAGLWTPVRVHFAPDAHLDGAQLSLIVPDGDGVPSRVSAPLPSPAPDSALLYVRFGRVHCPLTVRLERSAKVLAQREFAPGESSTETTIPSALHSSQQLVVAIASAPLGIADAITQMRETAEQETQLVVFGDTSSLPDRWYGYEGVGLVVLSGTDVDCYAGLAADDARLEALSLWVRRGGRLLIAVGEYGEQLLGPAGPLRNMVPGTFSKTVSLSQARQLERFSNSEESLPTLVNGKMLQVAQLMDVDGIVRGEGNLPLIVNRVWGFGRVIFLATDLDRGPLGQWGARPMLLAKLLGWPVKPVKDDDEDKTILHFGYTDLAGQLRSALDQFEGVRKIPFGLIGIVILVYLALVGPGDYFLLKKYLGRMELTWVTFPVTVLLFCAVAYAVAHYTKGDRFLVNQATVIDVDSETGEMRGTAWANVFSPETRRLNVRFTVPGRDEPADSEPQIVTAWFGLPGKALGGMDPVAPPPTIWSQPYDFSDDGAQLTGMPLQVWSSKSLTTRWSGAVGPTFECDLEEKGPIPSGRITSRLEVPLADCLLIYGAWVYELKTLVPGKGVRVGATVKRRELASFLTGQKLVFDEEQRVLRQATRYSIESHDPEYILRAMTFFQAAGGRPYTRLANSYQGFLDMSGLLQPDRAVLVGKVAAPEDKTPENHSLPWDARISLSSDGKTIPVREKHTTLLRFVLPVRTNE